MPHRNPFSNSFWKFAAQQRGWLLVFDVLLLIYLFRIGGIDSGEDLRNLLKSLYDTLVSLTQLSVAVILLALIVTLVHWMSARSQGILILPFANTSEGYKCDGRAISDSLIAEVQRIRRIHSQQLGSSDSTLHGPLPIVESANVKLQLVDPDAEERVSASIKELVTVGVGDTKLSVGAVLLTIKRLWPLGDAGSFLTGSVQQYGDVLRLVARMEHHGQVFAWEISRAIPDSDFPGLIRDLSYMIVLDLAATEEAPAGSESVGSAPRGHAVSASETPNGEGSAKTWEGFKYFTEARESYYRFALSGRDADFSSAREHCLAALEVEKGYRKLFGLVYKLGVVLMERSEFHQAEELFLHAATLKPDDGRCQNALGHAYYHQARYEEAMDAFQQAIRCGQKDPWAISNLGLVYLQQCRYPEALANYRQAIALDPNFVWGPVNLGSAYWHMGYFEQAQTEFQKAIKIDAKFAWAYHGMGIVHLLREENDNAIRSFKQAIECDSKFFPSYVSLVEAYLSQKHTDCAGLALEKARSLRPHDYNLLFVSGLLSALRGEESQARDDWRNAIANCGTHAPMDQLRRALWTIAAGEERSGLEQLRNTVRAVTDQEQPLQGILCLAKQKAALIDLCPGSPATIKDAVSLLEEAISDLKPRCSAPLPGAPAPTAPADRI